MVDMGNHARHWRAVFLNKQNQKTNTMKFLMGTKGRMTQVFDETGKVHAGTAVVCESMTAVQLKTKEKDGYDAVQYGFGSARVDLQNKAAAGHLKDLPALRFLREAHGATGVARGDVAGVTLFTPGDIIEVSALSKAKGFQGVVKRYRFAGDLATHGHKHTERAPGSIGGGGRAGGRVIKGKRMAGRMGGDRVTVKNLRILAVDSKTNTIIISGAVPGHPGALVEIRG